MKRHSYLSISILSLTIMLRKFNTDTITYRTAKRFFTKSYKIKRRIQNYPTSAKKDKYCHLIAELHAKIHSFFYDYDD
jgi:hypothetical protein